MSHQCAGSAELARLAALPADDAERLEAAACPRCDSLLRAQAAFLAGDPSIPADEADRARAALAARLAELAAKPAPARRLRPSPVAVLPVRRVRPAVPRWAWGAGLAATVALAILLGAPDGLRPVRPSGVLRGGAGATALDLPVAIDVDQGTGQVRLAWPAVAGATRYEVELYTSDLDTIGAFTATGEPSVLVDGAAFGKAGPAGALCRIRAYRAEGAAGASRLAPLPGR